MGVPWVTKREIKEKPDRDVVLVYAKATFEIGNIGVSGALFRSRLKKALPGRVAVQGAGYLWLTSGLSLIFKCGSERATRSMLAAIREVLSSGEDRKIVLAGYSQGCLIVRKALLYLSDAERARITAVAFFGDPSWWGKKVPDELKDNTMDIRLPLDWVHLPLPIPGFTHLLYPVFSYGKAVRFISAKVGPKDSTIVVNPKVEEV